MDAYNNITIGDIVSELELRRQSLHIFNNTLKGVPTGNIAADGTAEYLITELNGGSVQISTIGQDGESKPVSQGKGIGVRQHDDVMLSFGYSHKITKIVEIPAGQFAVVTLTIPVGLNHHVEGRYLESYNGILKVNVTLGLSEGNLPAVVDKYLLLMKKVLTTIHQLNLYSNGEDYTLPIR